MRFFYIFTANDHGQKTFPSQWLSCGALQSLFTCNLHHRTLSSICQRLLQGLARSLLYNGDKHSHYMNRTTCLAPFWVKWRQRLSWYVLLSFGWCRPEQAFHPVKDESTGFPRGKVFLSKSHGWFWAESRCSPSWDSFSGMPLTLKTCWSVCITKESKNPFL